MPLQENGEKSMKLDAVLWNMKCSELIDRIMQSLFSWSKIFSNPIKANAYIVPIIPNVSLFFVFI